MKIKVIKIDALNNNIDLKKKRENKQGNQKKENKKNSKFQSTINAKIKIYSKK